MDTQTKSSIIQRILNKETKERRAQTETLLADHFDIIVKLIEKNNLHAVELLREELQTLYCKIIAEMDEIGMLYHA